MLNRSLARGSAKTLWSDFLDARGSMVQHMTTPNTQEFMKNTQALRVVNSVARAPLSGKCRGGNQDEVD